MSMGIDEPNAAIAISPNIIEGNASIHDIEKVNTEQMDNLMNNPYKNYLFVVYSGIFNKKPEMFEEIKNLQNSLKDRSILEIVAIDHDTNDVGEYYDTELPILFLKTKKDNIVEYEGEVTFEHWKDFAVKHVPELKVEDISFGEDI